MLRSVLGIPAPKCVMGAQVFKQIWPDVKDVDGSQPAPASLSAFGELGLPWAIIVMVLSGVALGIIGAVSAANGGPLFAALSAAGGGFGYYLTQVPFISSFTYPHGLFVFLIPIAILFAVAIVRFERVEAL